MDNQMTHALRTTIVAAVLSTALTGCNLFQRMADVGSEPQLTSIENPTHDPNYRTVSMPMPTPERPATMANSLWRPGSRAFFKDLRASEIGDIVTVVVDLDDKAELDNETIRARDTSEDADVTSLLGYEASLNDILPEAVDPLDLLDIDSDSNYKGNGEIDREEKVKIKLAAIVTQILPNGNLVISGRQEIRVNYELRDIRVAGVIRPEDIDNSNQIAYEKIAEARIAYGGRGDISDVQQPRYGTQIVDILFPF